MSIRDCLGWHWTEFSSDMEFSPHRDRTIYRCVHAALVFIAAVFVLAGFSSAILVAIVLSLVLTGHDARQVYFSRRCALAGLIVLGLYVIGLSAALPFAGPVGSFAGLAAISVLLLLAGSLILWFWSADRLYDAEFRLPPEETGPW